MRYISLLVHEALDVVIDQLQNFKLLLPNSFVVIHISPSSDFSKEMLERKLKINNLDFVMINPKQVKTMWGSIIEAHISNIEFIQSLSDAHQIVFHSSNDMLVKIGAENYLNDNLNIFHRRNIISPTYWWPGKIALQDNLLLRRLRSYHCNTINASQIEGSAYDASLLFDIVDEIQKEKLLHNNLVYPREEIFFSSLAFARGVQATGLPYIFSELHRYDKLSWKLFDTYQFLYNNIFLKKLVNKLLLISDFTRIKKKDIEAIQNNNYIYLLKYQYLNDGNFIWKIYEAKHLYGVKRIQRNINDFLRRHIANTIVNISE